MLMLWRWFEKLAIDWRICLRSSTALAGEIQGGIGATGFRPPLPIGIPIAVPTRRERSCFAAKLLSESAEMMSEDAKFALGF